jgi:LysM repeat protein
LVLPAAFIVSSLILTHNCHAITASYGHPYQGHLENGVVFPNQFPGYHLRDESRSYTTPEVVGALLDAIEAVRAQFPDTCDLFIGDFSCQNGGSAIHHRSHQNGRDVDIGLYAKGNRPLNSLVTMGEDNLDAAKTWCLIENLIASQRVQYIFLDRRIQKILYEYAVTRGYDQAYLGRVFGNVRGSLIQHIRNHYDHMHVRFFTPWSTLGAHIGSDESDKLAVIEAAQQSYLPKKVNYYVNGSEKGLGELANSFGVTVDALCRWNHVNQASVLVPGSCLVFYKRSFESEPVLLARSLQPGFIAQTHSVRMASLNTEPAQPSISDSTFAEDEEPAVKEKKSEVSSAPNRTFNTCKAKRGDTLDKIARRNKLDVRLLCELNGIKRTTPLKPGQTVKTAVSRVYADSDALATDSTRAGSKTATVRKRGGSSSICFASVSKKPDSPTAAYYTVNNGGTLKDVSKKTGIPLSSLCQLNGLSRNSNLKPGQRIKLMQANLPVKPSLGAASCSVGNSSKKHETGKPGKLDKKTLKPAEAKAGHKPAAKPGTSQSLSLEKSKSKAPAKQAARKPLAKEMSKPGKSSTAQRKTPETKSGARKAEIKAAAQPVKRTALAKR